jgi:hypothetical protein
MKGGQVTRDYDNRTPNWTPSEEPFAPGARLKSKGWDYWWKGGGKKRRSRFRNTMEKMSLSLLYVLRS